MDLKKEPFTTDNLRNHAEGYMNRIRGFLDGLLNWSVTWNIALLAVSFVDLSNEPRNSIAASIFGFVLNIFVGLIYCNQRNIGLKLISDGLLPQFSEKDQSKSGVVWSLLAILFFLIQVIYLFLFSLNICRLRSSVGY